MAELLQVRDLSAGYGEAVILHDVLAGAGRGRDAGTARAQRHRQDDTDEHAGGCHPPARRQHHPVRQGAAHAPVVPAGSGWHWLGAPGAQYLQVPHGARKPHRRGPARQMDARTGVRDVQPAWRNAKETWARNCLVGSSRCWRWAVRWCSIRRCCCWTNPWKVWPPIIVQELLAAIRRITRDEGLSAIIVEQHPQAILAISDRAAVLDRGTVVYSGQATDLLDQPELLDQLLGVARVAS